MAMYKSLLGLRQCCGEILTTAAEETWLVCLKSSVIVK